MRECPVSSAGSGDCLIRVLFIHPPFNPWSPTADAFNWQSLPIDLRAGHTNRMGTRCQQQQQARTQSRFMVLPSDSDSLLVATGQLKFNWAILSVRPINCEPTVHSAGLSRSSFRSACTDAEWVSPASAGSSGDRKRFIICHRLRKWVNRIQCLNDTNFPISLL